MRADQQLLLSVQYTSAMEVLLSELQQGIGGIPYGVSLTTTKKLLSFSEKVVDYVSAEAAETGESIYLEQMRKNVTDIKHTMKLVQKVVYDTEDLHARANTAPGQSMMSQLNALYVSSAQPVQPVQQAAHVKEEEEPKTTAPQGVSAAKTEEESRNDVEPVTPHEAPTVKRELRGDEDVSGTVKMEEKPPKYPTKETKEERRCAWCKNTNVKLYLCGGCNKVWFCGIECQTAEWPRHREECRAIARSKTENQNTAQRVRSEIVRHAQKI